MFYVSIICNTLVYISSNAHTLLFIVTQMCILLVTHIHCFF